MTIKLWPLSKREDLNHGRRPRVCHSRLLSALTLRALDGEAWARTRADCSGQLRYRSRPSAVFYGYHLIGGTRESLFLLATVEDVCFTCRQLEVNSGGKKKNKSF